MKNIKGWQNWTATYQKQLISFDDSMKLLTYGTFAALEINENNFSLRFPEYIA